MIDKMESVKATTKSVNLSTIKEDKFKVIRALKTIFGGCEQFILTGSTVVKLQGFHMLSEGDIDICLYKPSEATMELLRRHVADYPVRTNNDKLALKGMFLFGFQGWKVDIFITHEKYDDRLQYDGVILSSVMALVDAKKKYHRLKDILQLRKWAKQIFNEGMLDNELDCVILNEEYDVHEC
jgi:hypothetical protein